MNKMSPFVLNDFLPYLKRSPGWTWKGLASYDRWRTGANGRDMIWLLTPPFNWSPVNWPLQSTKDRLSPSFLKICGCHCLLPTFKVLGTAGHERVGEEFLEGLGFPKEVTQFVRGHVQVPNFFSTLKLGYWWASSSVHERYPNHHKHLNFNQAKRYLVFKNPSYHDCLSEASKGTLVCQVHRIIVIAITMSIIS